MNFDWIKTIPDYQAYFNADHQLIINAIGIDNYIELYVYFGKTGVYFPVRQYEESGTDDKHKIIELIGENNYKKLFDNFSKSGIYFSSQPITNLKKAWVRINKNVDYKTAARTMDTAVMTIYKWRSEKYEEQNDRR